MRMKYSRRLAGILVAISLPAVITGLPFSSAAHADDVIPLPIMGCSPDEIPMTYLGGERETDGGFIYRFSDQNGIVTTVPQLPDGLDPANATDVELELYGFPTRPTAAADLADWLHRFAHLHYLPASQPCISKTVSAAPMETTTYSNIWAGKELEGPTNSFSLVTGDWVMPQIYTTACQGGALGQGLTNWVGLSKSGALLQDGFNSYGGNNGWYEYAGPGGTSNKVDFGNSGQQPSIYANPGDQVTSYTSYDSVHFHATFSVANYTQTTATTPHSVGRGTSYYNGAQAVWITERPSLTPGGPQNITQASPVYWTAAIARSASGTQYGSGGTYPGFINYRIFMQGNSPNSNPLENPHGWSTTTAFQNNWGGYCN